MSDYYLESPNGHSPLDVKVIVVVVPKNLRTPGSTVTISSD